jgi:hypothetical protein
VGVPFINFLINIIFRKNMMDWHSQANSSRIPPALNEWTICEYSAILYKVTGVNDPLFGMLVQQGAFFLDISIPYEVDLTSISGGNPVNLLQNEMNDGKRQLKKTLPISGPNFENNQQEFESFIDWVVENLRVNFPLIYNIYSQIDSFLYSPFDYLLKNNSFLKGTFHGGRKEEVKLSLFDDSFAIQHLCWHNNYQTFAICHRQNVIFLYDLEKKDWLSSSLTCPDMTEIIGCSWRPFTPNVLAVASKNGIFVWEIRNIFKKQTDIRAPQRDLVSRFTDMKDITCINWTVDGNLVVGGCGSNGSLIICDVDQCKSLIIKRVANATLELSFSPSGLYLVVCQSISGGRGRLRIFETMNWTDYVIDFPTVCKNVNWFPESNGFLFSLENRCDIKCMRFMGGNNFISSSSFFSSWKYTLETTYSLKEKIYEYSTGKLQCRGNIDRMALSPSGTRLIVSFKKNISEPGSCYLLVLNVKFFGPMSVVQDS